MVEPVVAYTKDDFFVGLISNRADLTYGEAIFKIKNPTPFSLAFSTQNLNFFIQKNNTPTKSMNIYRLKDIFYSYNVTDYKQNCTKYTENKTDNYTLCEDIPNGWHWNNYTKEEFRKFDFTDNIGSDNIITILVNASWNPKIGLISMDWIPYISYVGINYTKPEWAWWNTSWNKCKNLTLSTSSTYNMTDEWVEVNVTGLTFSNLNEIRIINNSCKNGGSQIGRDILNSSATSATVGFYANYTTTDAEHVYSIYYNGVAEDHGTATVFVVTPNWTSINTSVTTTVGAYAVKNITTAGFLDSYRIWNSTGTAMNCASGAQCAFIQFYNGSYALTTGASHTNVFLGNLTYRLRVNKIANLIDLQLQFYKNKIRVIATQVANNGVASFNIYTLPGGTATATAKNSTGTYINTSGTTAQYPIINKNWTASYVNTTQYTIGHFGTQLRTATLSRSRQYVDVTNYNPMSLLGSDVTVNYSTVNNTILEYRILAYDNSYSDNKTKYILPVEIAFNKFMNPLSVAIGSEESSYTTDTCTYTSGDWNINIADKCNLTTATNVSGNVFIYGNGTFGYTLFSSLNFTKFYIFDNATGIIACKKGSVFKTW